MRGGVEVFFASYGRCNSLIPSLSSSPRRRGPSGFGGRLSREPASLWFSVRARKSPTACFADLPVAELLSLLVHARSANGVSRPEGRRAVRPGVKKDNQRNDTLVRRRYATVRSGRAFRQDVPVLSKRTRHPCRVPLRGLIVQTSLGSRGGQRADRSLRIACQEKQRCGDVPASTQPPHPSPLPRQSQGRGSK